MARPTLSPEAVTAAREHICEIALRELDDHGPRALSWRALATELGCSHAAPYRYFDGKAALLAATRTLAAHRMANELRARLTSVASENRLTTLAAAYLDNAEGKPHAYRLIVDRPELGDESSPLQTVLADEIRAAVEAGRLAGEADEMTVLLWATLHGLACLGCDLEQRSQLAVALISARYGPGDQAENPRQGSWKVW